MYKRPINLKSVYQFNRLDFKIFIPLLFVVFWSSGGFFIKISLNYCNPVSLLFIRLLISLIIMWVICISLRVKYNLKVMNLLLLIITGLLLQLSYQLFSFVSLDLNVTPGLLSVILGIQPILTAILTKDIISKKKFLGLIIGFFSISLVISNNLFSNKITILGISSSILALLCITTGTILQSKIKINLPWSLAIQYTASLFFLIVLSPLFDYRLFDIKWTLPFFLSLSWLVLIVSIGSSMLLYYLVQKRNTTNVTSLFYCVPPLTTLADYSLFGTRMNFISISGLLLCCIGIKLINTKKQ